ncbi:MAG: co-chaperone DjlA [Marinicella sp.]|nr:co-chaperone DjlA [Xanthomonadales bacterium]
MGIIIGSILGFKFGGWFGMLLGAWVGYSIEQKISGPVHGEGKKQTQESFFNALFLTMGKIAKIDGKVSTSEINRAEGIMQHMKLNHEMRQKAIDLFSKGKDPAYHIDGALRQFGQFARRSLSLKQIFLEMLIDVAEADGKISPPEQALLQQVCQQIGYPVQMLIAMMKMRGFASGGYQQHQSDSWQGRSNGGSRQHRHQRQTAQNRSAPFNPYHVLGVDQTDNKATVRRAYKRLMSQHHPDKLIAKGLPPEMMKVAEEKAKQVQLAWEKVKELKGW